MRAFAGIYQNRRVLITGHTGFKGSWLALWLKTLGANITGLSLEPNSSPSHWELIDLDINDKRVDILDAQSLFDVVKQSSPEIIFHLAAKSLVRPSYRNPLETLSTNIIGTANILESCRYQPSVRAIVIVTSDKCYENQGKDIAYQENDPLGGHDPYSASKAGAELVVSSYRKSFFNYSDAPLLASARAGNVIGGGDWSEDRLIPDLVRSISNNEILPIRSPNATRPWQHVLESLSGYLCLGQKLLMGNKEFSEAWNFGPNTNVSHTVEEVLKKLNTEWPAIKWRIADDPKLHEASLLNIDSQKASQKLAWQSIWPIDKSLSATAQWYQANLSSKNVVISLDQIREYVGAASDLGLEWSIK